MSPPRGASADKAVAPQSAQEIAALIEEFLAQWPEAAVLEDGKVLFSFAPGGGGAKCSIAAEHERCTLHLWSEQRNLVRRVVAVTERGGTLRLSTQRFGQTQTKLMELVASREKRTPTVREGARQSYVALLERVLGRAFAGWKPDGFRTAMDLEKSFGPAYARGSLVKGTQAWAVIGVNERESATTVDGVLTLGILWLDACRERGAGRRLYQGLKVVLPKGMATLTLSRMAWLNAEAAQWELWELDPASEELEQRDAADVGNLRTRLVHRPDEAAAAERFANAIPRVMQLVPRGEEQRVEQRLRSPAEMAFLLHGMEFARARIGLAANSFAHTLEIAVGAAETPLTPANQAELGAMVAELFARRRAAGPRTAGPEALARYGGAGTVARRRIGAPMSTPAHAKVQPRVRPGAGRSAPQQDPLYRAAPERWLESVLRRDLAPLTRSLAPPVRLAASREVEEFANEADPDTIGNRADAAGVPHAGLSAASPLRSDFGRDENVSEGTSRVIPRLDPEHVYAQVPAIAGAGDRGLLDLLGVTADGRLAVIELKADEDLHFALQGLDYWIRVRHHHLQTADTATGLGEFQRHGYFRGVELSPLPPRLYLVAPALRVHPATETVLRYVSPRVEWTLLALDERWRQEVKVVWRKQGGRG
jgi:hypothetical protein